MTTATQTTDKTAGLPPPLPAAAKGAAKPLSEAGHALFGGMKEHMATKGAPGVMSGLLKGASLEALKSAFLDELEQISLEKDAADLTEEARSHIAKKNFAVSAKASNTGKPAYPIEDKAHAKAALGLAAMHGDKKDLAEVRKDVGKKFPGMEKKEAFAVTEKGHQHDAEAYELLARQMAERAALMEQYKGLGHMQEGGGTNYGSIGGVTRFNAASPLSTPFGFQRPDEAARHYEYAAKKHREGSNAWNPFGGALTPSQHEEGGVPGLLGGYGKSVPKPAAKKKEAAMSPDEQQLAAAWQQHRAGMTGGQKLREILSTLGGAGVGAGLGAGVGNLGARGLNAVAGRQLMRPSTGTGLGAMTGLGLGGGLGSIIGDVHGESDVRAGKSLENYANLEDRVLGSGHSAVRSAQKVQGGKKEAGVSFAAFSDAFMATLGFDRTKTAGVLSNLGKA